MVVGFIWFHSGAPCWSSGALWRLLGFILFRWVHSGIVSGPQTAFRFTHARGEVSIIICNLIARWKVVCAIGVGFSVHCASIPAQAIIGCDGVSYSITDHKAYLVVGAYKWKG